MTTITIQLPDDLARQVQQAGLLSSTTIEEILREKLKDRKVETLFSAMEKMASIDAPAFMSPEEITSEIAALHHK